MNRIGFTVALTAFTSMIFGFYDSLKPYSSQNGILLIAALLFVGALIRGQQHRQPMTAFLNLLILFDAVGLVRSQTSLGSNDIWRVLCFSFSLVLAVLLSIWGRLKRSS